MTDTPEPESPSPKLSKSERKKARRRAQLQKEKAAARELDVLADSAIEQALNLATEVADAPTRDAAERVLDIEVTSVDAARFVLRRINETLAVAEWLDEVEAWVWEKDVHTRAPLSENGRIHGVEVRMEKARRPAL